MQRNGRQEPRAAIPTQRPIFRGYASRSVRLARRFEDARPASYGWRDPFGRGSRCARQIGGIVRAAETGIDHAV
jgi:hypothetical protein